MHRERRRLELAQRLHRRPPHIPDLVLEPGDEGAGVRRERRRLELAQRRHRRLPHTRVLMLEPGDDGAGVRRERRRLELAQRLHRRPPQDGRELGEFERRWKRWNFLLVQSSKLR